MISIHKTSNNINNILKSTPIISQMVTDTQIIHILSNLESTLDSNIEGEIVELGCNIGTTSIFIRKLLDLKESKKEYYVYDSFEGLPAKLSHDMSNTAIQYKEGSCKTSLDLFTNTFKNYNLKKPIVCQGWFKNIDESSFPKKISFAFFDGDFYSSIIDSFDKIYSKLSPGAKVIIHDYGWDALPGVKKACDDFLKNKPEKILMLEVGIGLLIKK
ncbi:TylF/MycF/NovP-related O-methyltransferase [Halarcobacter sp.]|uniref:TylF/MycF/NovP-related O-methyltransferase n=1 Tax=Halarcobacter sp. TaxID=2321133 RepID=UPI0029F51B15|nr:TylF/MycF/NovP-related O-methyltransferase [Halarcobacter sp.]